MHCTPGGVRGPTITLRTSPARVPWSLWREDDLPIEPWAPVITTLIAACRMPASPRVSHWVHRLHEQGWLQAIASAAPRPNIEVLLEALGLPTVFKASCLRKMCTGESPIRKCTWRQHRGWELCPPG